MNDKHIVIYTGKKSLKYANTLKNETLQQIAWLGFDMDYGTYANLIFSKLEQADVNQNLTEEQKKAMSQTQEMLKKMKFKVNETMNVTDDGIVIDMNSSMY